jgi:hypothetical protein
MHVDALDRARDDLQSQVVLANGPEERPVEAAFLHVQELDGPGMDGIVLLERQPRRFFVRPAAERRPTIHEAVDVDPRPGAVVADAEPQHRRVLVVGPEGLEEKVTPRAHSQGEDRAAPNGSPRILFRRVERSR